MSLQLFVNIVFTGFGLAVFGGLWNRLRGGGQESISFEPIKRLSHQVKRLILAVIITTSLYLPFFIIPIINPLQSMTDWVYFFLVFLASLVLGLVPGWGSWFFVGRAEDSWAHNSDAPWVEYISYWKFGKKWIPTNWPEYISEDEYRNLKSRFNLTDSPTGKVRPLEWRIAMEKFSMSVRGLGLSIPAPTVLAIHLFFEYNFILWILPLIWCTGWLMGWCYDKINHLDRKRWPVWLQSNTQLGEFLTGAIVMTGLHFFLISFSLVLI